MRTLRELRSLQLPEAGDDDSDPPGAVLLEACEAADAEHVIAAFCEDGIGDTQEGRVLSVERARYPPARVRDFLAAVDGDPAPPCAAFHGITAEPTPERVSAIVATGLDPRRCRSALFGKGAYVAASGLKARMYASGAQFERRHGGSTLVERHALPLKVLAALLAHGARPGDVVVGEKGKEHCVVTADSAKNPTQFCIPLGLAHRLIITHVITVEPAPPQRRKDSSAAASPQPATNGSGRRVASPQPARHHSPRPAASGAPRSPAAVAPGAYPAPPTLPPPAAAPAVNGGGASARGEKDGATGRRRRFSSVAAAINDLLSADAAEDASRPRARSGTHAPRPSMACDAGGPGLSPISPRSPARGGAACVEGWMENTGHSPHSSFAAARSDGAASTEPSSPSRRPNAET